MHRTSNSEPVNAGVYCRMSLQRDGDTTKVHDQQRICRGTARQLGWEVAEGVGYPHPDGVYTDNNESAWKLNRKRNGWDAMLADVEAGKINAIVVYHGDRLIRQPRDLEDLIDLARSKGIRLASPTGTRNLGNPDDQFILRIEAAQACRASDDTSRRQKARFDRWQREGRVFSGGPGGRRLGYCSDGMTLFPADRCEMELRREVTEAEIIREAARRILAGESANAIEADLRRRGWTTPAGKRIQHGSLKRWLCNPRYAGLMPDGETQAAWPAILERETWERVRLVLEGRAAAYPSDPGNGAKHLLSGIATCACGHAVTISYSFSRGYKSVVYGCGKREGGCGKVWRSAAHLDAYAGAAVVALLANPLNPEGRVVPVDYTAEWKVLDRERAETEAKLRDWKSSAGNLDALAARLDGIDKRMAELRELAAGDGRTRLLERYQGITREQWDALDLTVRRALVAACFRVTVLPASRRGPGFRAEDVRLDPA